MSKLSWWAKHAPIVIFCCVGVNTLTSNILINILLAIYVGLILGHSYVEKCIKEGES